jgi:hypothetical protein
VPKFFFNTHGEDGAPDFIGRELKDLDCARDEAVILAAEALKASAALFWTRGRWSMEVCDDSGLVLFILTFAALEMPFARAAPYGSLRARTP